MELIRHDYDNGAAIYKVNRGLFTLWGTYQGAEHCIGEFLSLEGVEVEYKKYTGEGREP